MKHSSKKLWKLGRKTTIIRILRLCFMKAVTGLNLEGLPLEGSRSIDSNGRLTREMNQENDSLTTFQLYLFQQIALTFCLEDLLGKTFEYFNPEKD